MFVAGDGGGIRRDASRPEGAAESVGTTRALIMGGVALAVLLMLILAIALIVRRRRRRLALVAASASASTTLAASPEPEGARPEVPPTSS